MFPSLPHKLIPSPYIVNNYGFVADLQILFCSTLQSHIIDFSQTTLGRTK